MHQTRMPMFRIEPVIQIGIGRFSGFGHQAWLTLRPVGTNPVSLFALLAVGSDKILIVQSLHHVGHGLW